MLVGCVSGVRCGRGWGRRGVLEVAEREGEGGRVFLVALVRLRGRPVCVGCGGGVWSKGWRDVRLVDQPVFGRPVCLVWRKRRWRCPDVGCGVGSFTDRADWIAPVRGRLTCRAGRWATEQVGRLGRTVAGVAGDLGCGWHTIDGETIRWGEALLDADQERVGAVDALGLDETLFQRRGEWNARMWMTSAVDTRKGQLIDIFPGKDAKSAVGWLLDQPSWWREGVQWAVLDLSGAYKAAYNQALPQATQVADPFHVVGVANRCLTQTRRRVQEETLGHRGRKADPLFRVRNLLTLAAEKLDHDGRQKLQGLLQAGDPHGEVRLAWHAKETTRQIYKTTDPGDADAFVRQLARDLQDESCPPEVNRLGRTLQTWRPQIVAWHHAQVSNASTEAVNNLIKRIKRIAFGFRNFRNYRTRALLYAGKPNPNLLPTHTPPKTRRARKVCNE